MKIAVAQINITAGDLKANSEKILDYIKKAEDNEADLIIFPEMSLIGATCLDLYKNRDFLKKSQEAFEKLVSQINISCLISHIRQDNSKNNFFNSVFFIKNKKIQKFFDKKILKEQELKYFTGDLNNSLNNSINNNFIELENNKFFVCFDTERELLLNNNFNNNFNYYIFLASSEYSVYIKNIKQERFLKFAEISQKLNEPVIFVNQVGATDELIHDGGSFCVNKQDNNNYYYEQAESFKENLLIINTGNNFSFENNNKFINNINIIQELKQALILGIRDYFEKTKFKKALIGLSGGIDSALVCSLAVEALGAENITGLIMPSKYSSEASITDAKALAQNWNINYEIIYINKILEIFLQSCNLRELSLAEENAQARIRALILMGKANENNSLVLATGNKSEIAVGFATLYGDTCGALEPIGDLWKTEVWQMAKTFKQIPQEIIDKPPSAELRPNHRDTDSLPDYKILDEILKLYIEKNSTLEEINKINPEVFTKKLILKVFNLIKNSEFKRKQASVTLKITDTCFYSDWKRPIASGFSCL